MGRDEFCSCLLVLLAEQTQVNLFKAKNKAEGRQFVKQHFLETNQRVMATVLVFEHNAHREMREWIVMENPYRKDHIVAVHWASSKDDYDLVRQEIYPIVKQMRLLSGPPEWREEKPISRSDEHVG